MVLCWIALPIFAILGIFSARYRRLTRDSFECLFKTMTFRKCQTGLDDKFKSDITATVMKFSPRTAGFVYKNYKLLSWIFLILLVWSTYYTSIGVYNYIQYGNCNGPDSTGFCIFDPLGENSQISTCSTEDLGINSTSLNHPQVESNDPIIGNLNAELTIIEFGCYTCPYTKKAEPVIKEVLDYYKGRVNLQFKDFPLQNHNLSYETTLAANCANEQDKYEKYHNELFKNQEVLTEQMLYNLANSLKLDVVKFTSCITNETYKDEIESDREQGISALVPGTPTFFINGNKIVGPKPFKTFKTIIDGELK